MKALRIIFLLCALRLCGLIPLSAQPITRSFYFTHEQNGNTNVTYIRLYLSPDAMYLVTHTNNIACISIATRELLTNSTAFATLDYWFGDTNALLAAEAPELVPYVPPERTPEQLAAVKILISNRLYAATAPFTSPAYRTKSGTLKFPR